MATYTADIEWQRGDDPAHAGLRYSRRHHVRFDGGAELVASSSPHVVPVPMSDASAVDPEEMFVASLASCHMLFFLSIAAARGHDVVRYADAALGTMAKNADGRIAMTRVTLRPHVEFASGLGPAAAELDEIHHLAHAECFIANSVRTEVVCEPVLTAAPAEDGRR